MKFQPGNPGKPSSYTAEVGDEICRRLAEGEPLAQICRDEHMPAVRTVSDWKANHEDFALKFQDARTDGFDAIAADCLHIADTPLPGVAEELEEVEVVDPAKPDDPPTRELRVVKRKREDMLGHRRLQIDTRLKLLAKWDRARYGDHVTLAGDPDAPLSGLSDAELDARIAEKMAKLGQPQ